MSLLVEKLTKPLDSIGEFHVLGPRYLDRGIEAYGKRASCMTLFRTVDAGNTGISDTFREAPTSRRSQATHNYSVRLLDPATGESSIVAKFGGSGLSVGWALSVSPDEKTILYTSGVP